MTSPSRTLPGPSDDTSPFGRCRRNIVRSQMPMDTGFRRCGRFGRYFSPYLRWPSCVPRTGQPSPQDPTRSGELDLARGALQDPSAGVRTHLAHMGPLLPPSWLPARSAVAGSPRLFLPPVPCNGLLTDALPPPPVLHHPAPSCPGFSPPLSRLVPPFSAPGQPVSHTSRTHARTGSLRVDLRSDTPPGDPFSFLSHKGRSIVRIVRGSGTGRRYWVFSSDDSIVRHRPHRPSIVRAARPARESPSGS